MSKTRIEGLWEAELRHAAQLPLVRDGLRLTRMDPVSAQDIYAGIDDAGHRVLAIGVTTRPPAIALESRTLDYFRQQRANGTWLLVLRLIGNGLDPVFGRLCQDLVDSAILVDSERELLSLFSSRLHLWQKLFRGSDDGLLQPHQIRGLVAELLVLESIVLLGQRETTAAVAGWVGPCGADQDFIYGESAIEVKALSVGRRTVSISSLDQLNCSVPLKLAIVTLELSVPEASGALSLNSLVARLECPVASSSSALLDFRRRLLEAGYVAQPKYDEDMFIPLGTACFDVVAGFPKITRGLLPSAITEATYEIEVAALDSFKRDSVHD